jgi:hypothetical protein
MLKEFIIVKGYFSVKIMLEFYDGVDRKRSIPLNIYSVKIKKKGILFFL